MKRKSIHIIALVAALVSAPATLLLAGEGQQAAGVGEINDQQMNCPASCSCMSWTYYGCTGSAQSSCTPYDVPPNGGPVVSGTCVWNGSWWDCSPSS